MEGVDLAFAKTFGNYLLHGIDEVSLPDSVAWWPQTAGWFWLAVALLSLMVYLLFRQVKTYWRNRYRRQALEQLCCLEANATQWQQVVAELPCLLKAVALQAYPRTDVAALSGSEWLIFLDEQYKGSAFSGQMGAHLIAISYQSPCDWALNKFDGERLIKGAREWIKTHAADTAFSSINKQAPHA